MAKNLPAEGRRVEYRVAWKRVGHDAKSKIYQTAAGAQRFFTLLGSEPWTAYENEADELVCCSGMECGCMGLTHRQYTELKRKDMPSLVYCRIDVRRVDSWQEIASQ